MFFCYNKNIHFLEMAELGMKFVSLLLWVTQFGFSAVFPLCFFLLAASWLRDSFDLGLWVMILAGVLGTLTSVSTVRSCIRAMRKEAEKADSDQEPPVAFNHHD